MTLSAPLLVILAGGQGRRMGGNKPMALYEGRPLIAATLEGLKPQATDLVINAGIAGTRVAVDMEGLDCPLIHDAPALAGLGPLSGIHSALAHAARRRHESVITAPCDMPHLPATYVADLMAANGDDADVIHYSGASDYRLCGLWNTSLCGRLEAALLSARNQGGLAVKSFLAGVRVKTIAASPDSAFENINGPPYQAG